MFTLGAGLKITAAAVGVMIAGAIAHLASATQLLLGAACPLLAGAVGAFALSFGQTGGMPRQNRRRPEEPGEADAAVMGRGPVRRESGSDGDWLVRPVTGAAATKTYRCPGCDQEIRRRRPTSWPGPTTAPRRQMGQGCPIVGTGTPPVGTRGRGVGRGMCGDDPEHVWHGERAIRAATVLPARRTPLTLHTADGLDSSVSSPSPSTGRRSPRW